MNREEKHVVWLNGEVKTPPFSKKARINVGFLLRQLQLGFNLSMPDSRPMPIIGSRCHELRIVDGEVSKMWRIIYRIDPDAIIIGDVFDKKTQKTPKDVIDNCQKRFNRYDKKAMESSHG